MNLGHFLLGAILYIFCFLLIVASITMYQLYQEDYQYKQTYKEFIKDFINDTKREFKKFTLFGKIVYILLIIFVTIPITIITTIIFILHGYIWHYFVLGLNHLFVKKEYWKDND